MVPKCPSPNTNKAIKTVLCDVAGSKPNLKSPCRFANHVRYGFARFFYILNWVFRWKTDWFYCWTQILSGTLQTGLYADFLYWYYVAKKEGKSMIELPI